MEGFIMLHRKLLDWEWYDDINTSRLFIHCLLKANHKDNNWRGMSIKRGQFISSLSKLASETSLTVKQIRTSLKKLNSTNEVASKGQAQHTVFTVINYDTYQGEGKQRANEGQTKGKRRATNNNDNNDNNENNPIVSTESQRGKFKFNDKQFSFASEMLRRIMVIAPNTKKPNLDSWANTIRLMNESDNIPLNDAWKVFVWANQDQFWQKNILSADKFRKQYPQLSMRMNPVEVQQPVKKPRAFGE